MPNRTHAIVIFVVIDIHVKERVVNTHDPCDNTLQITLRWHIFE